MTLKRPLLLALFATISLATACNSGTTVVSPPSMTSALPSTTAPSGSTAYSTLPTSIAEFMSYARTGVANQAVVKFSIPDFHHSDAVE